MVLLVAAVLCSPFRLFSAGCFVVELRATPTIGGPDIDTALHPQHLHVCALAPLHCFAGGTSDASVTSGSHHASGAVQVWHASMQAGQHCQRDRFGVCAVLLCSGCI
jgi:hypothetical protein